MTEIDNDKLLKDFFAENKREIADNGFSRRVMHQLPDRSNRLARLWTLFVMTVGAVLFITLGGLQAVWETLREVLIGMINHGAASLDPKSIIMQRSPAFHGRTESSIAGITSIAVPCANGLSQLCHCIGTAVPSRWHNCDSPLAQP